jgi:sugar (pentulose or hexulose) kinase
MGIFDPPYDRYRRYRQDLVDSLWDQPRLEVGNSSLREEIAKRGGLAISTWGADVGGLNVQDELVAGWNYMAVSKSVSRLSAWTRKLNSRDRHIVTGGACQFSHQPPEQLMWARWHMKPESRKKIAIVVPTGDLLLYKLTGRKVHQAGMLQAQGLGFPGARAAVETWVKLPRGSLCPWEILGRDQLVSGPNGVPCTGFMHDTECAWVPVFAEAPYGLATGSWLIAAAQLDGFPTDLGALFEAGVCVEGNPPNLSRNVGMFGPTMDVVLKNMRQEQETDAEDTEFVMAQTDLPLLPSDIPWQQDPTSAAARIYGLVPEPKRSWKMAYAILSHGVAREAVRYLQGLNKASGKPLDRVALVGGWAKSRAFCLLLEKYGGFKVVLPPYADKGASAGALAILLHAIAMAAGEPISMAEAIDMLPK